MKISIVVAVAENGIIGKDNQLLWKLSADLKRFKQITTGRYILMGRKTFESIGKPLPNRVSLIISRGFHCDADNCRVFPSVSQALEFAKANGQEEVFVVGGGEIYRQLLPLAETIYLTKVHTEIAGDTRFDCKEDDWKTVHSEFVPADEKNEFDSTYIILKREK